MDWKSITLFLHILTSIIAMGAGAVPLLFRDGQRFHRLAGKIYIWNIMGVSLTGLVLIGDHFEPIRLILPLYAFYAVTTAYRRLHQKGSSPTIIDWALTGFVLLFAAFLIALGIQSGRGLIDTTTRIDTAMSLLIIACSVLVTRDGIYDLITHTNPVLRERWWLYSHLERMVSSYIALMTGFVIHTVTDFLPVPYVYIAWVIPGSIGWNFSFWYILYLKGFRLPFLNQQKKKEKEWAGLTGF